MPETPDTPQEITPDIFANDGKDERIWAMLCHLSTFAGYVVPFGNIIAPLVLWVMKKDEYPLVDD